MNGQLEHLVKYKYYDSRSALRDMKISDSILIGNIFRFDTWVKDSDLVRRTILSDDSVSRNKKLGY